MPELPEVESVVRSIAPRVKGRRILQARLLSRLVMRSDLDATATALRGRSILSLARHGKYLLFDLDAGDTLTIHLGMTGKLLWNGPEGPYTRAVFELDSGRLVFDDVRQFGNIELCSGAPRRIAKLGPEPLSISFEDFAERLHQRRGRIKPLLLNQTFLRGLGNIYSDESLFRAGIHPRALAERLSRMRMKRLYEAIREVLAAAIEKGGSSISDYVDGEGRQGWFQFEHRVYGREGEPCKLCGAPIRRIVLAQRSAHYCSKCQRA